MTGPGQQLGVRAGSRVQAGDDILADDGGRGADGARKFGLNFCFKIYDNLVEICNTSHFEASVSISASIFASKEFWQKFNVKFTWKVYIKI